jgi:hypothetical protein
MSTANGEYVLAPNGNTLFLERSSIARKQCFRFGLPGANIVYWQDDDQLDDTSLGSLVHLATSLPFQGPGEGKKKSDKFQPVNITQQRKATPLNAWLLFVG